MDNLEYLDGDIVSSLWTFDEDGCNIDEVKRQLQETNDELQRVMSELAKTRQEMIRQEKTYKQNVIKLIYLLQVALKEKDEAENKSRQLMMMINSSHHPCRDGGGSGGQLSASVPPQLPPPSPSTTTHLPPRSTLSPQVNVGPTMNMDMIHDVISQNPINMAGSASTWANFHDVGSAVIEKLAQGRPKPEKGKLLESIMKAGPLLSSLMTSGSLPKWCNPAHVESPPPQVPRAPVDKHKANHGWPKPDKMGPSSEEGMTTSSGSWLFDYGNGFADQVAISKKQRIL